MNEQTSDTSVELYGYKYSVYAWIARLALHEKGVPYDWIEIDPFAENVAPAYLAMHPFRRVPTLKNDDFVLFETGAITRFIDENFAGPELQPSSAFERARVNQVISIVDSYAYWPLVRQVFSHGYFKPFNGETSDTDEITIGLEAAVPVLEILEQISVDDTFLLGDALSLADIHLAPMISYFTMPVAGQKLIEKYPRLSQWIIGMERRPEFIRTKPNLTA
ncbi:MAG: glutathione S-transferase family protein [Methyloligellaceae bacterium]